MGSQKNSVRFSGQYQGALPAPRAWLATTAQAILGQSWCKRGAGRGTRNSKDVHSQPEIGSRQWRSTELPVAQVVTELQKNCTQWRISQANPRRPCQFARAQGKVRKLLLCLRPGQKSVRPLRKSSSICAAAVRSAAPHPCWVAHSSGPSVGNCVTAALSDRRGFTYPLA